MGVEKEGRGAWWEAASKHGGVSEKGEGEEQQGVERPTHSSLRKHSFPRPETSGMGVAARLY